MRAPRATPANANSDGLLGLRATPPPNRISDYAWRPAFAVPPQTKPAGGRGKIATVPSGGAGKATASGMPPGLARARASLYVHART